MPQRKKAHSSHLPPLVFVNSPVFQPAPVLTPDLAVDNPVTAKIVQIENPVESSWVSPQFRTNHRCQSTLSHTSIYTRQRLKENQQDRRCQFKQLQFVSGGSKESLILIKPISELKSVPESDKGGASCNTGHANDEGSAFIYSDITLDDMNNIIVHTPVITEEDNCNQYLPEENSRANFSRCNYSNLNGSGIRNGTSDSKSIIITPTRVLHDGNTQQHGLLKPHKLFSQSICDDSVLPSRQSVDGNYLDIHAVRGLISPGIHAETTIPFPNIIVDVRKHNNIGVSKSITCSVSKSHCFSNNSALRSPTNFTEEAVIFAVDTPENEYGLTFRQRQLRCRSVLQD